MIVDIRTYTIVPRKMRAYLAAFEAYGLPVQQRAGLKLMGYFVHTMGEINTVTHLWEYENMADMEAKRAKRDADPGWLAYQAKTDGMVQAQKNSLATPASFSPIK